MTFLSRLFGSPSKHTLAPADFVALRDPAAPVLDVRTPEEYAAGHLTGADNVDVTASDFRQRVQALGLSTEGPIYLYCRSGNRSETATRILHELGYAGAVNVGGIGALAKAGVERT